MANNRSAFKRLLSTVPKVEQGGMSNYKEMVDYFSVFEKQYHSEMFLSKELLSRLQKSAHNQNAYDWGFIQIKIIASLVDQLYEVKYR